jgi:hypothetical protein
MPNIHHTHDFIDPQHAIRRSGGCLPFLFMFSLFVNTHFVNNRLVFHSYLKKELNCIERNSNSCVTLVQDTWHIEAREAQYRVKNSVT